MSRFAFSAVALLAIGACKAPDLTAPATQAVSSAPSARSEQFSDGQRALKLSYEKWITKYPAMTGNTGFGPGTFTGTILSRVVSADGFTIQLKASYTVTDPSRKGRSFTAVVEGTENEHKMTAFLTGVVTEGWNKGAPVSAFFRVIIPCDIPGVAAARCFRGTIRVRPAHENEGESD